MLGKQKTSQHSKTLTAHDTLRQGALNAIIYKDRLVMTYQSGIYAFTFGRREDLHTLKTVPTYVKQVNNSL